MLVLMQLEELTRSAISAELTQRGMSQRALARQLGWSQQYLRNRLIGRYALTTTDLEKIAAALDVPVTTFLPTAEPAGGGTRA